MKRPAEWTWERIQKCQEEYDAYRLELSRGDDRPLRQFLWHVTMDSQPEPLPFHRIYRPWQWERISRRAPAVESACGRNPGYKGPRGFWETWPRGHDKTGETARMCVWAAAFAARPIAGTVAASDEEQAGHILTAASRTVELNPWLRPFVKVQSSAIVGSMGCVQVTAYDAAGAYGKTDDITICDELTWWKGRQLFDTLLSGMPKRDNGVFLITTNAGVTGSWQEQVRDSFKRQSGQWSVYESPEGEVLADWMNRDYIEGFRDTMNAGVFSRVWENRWVDSAESPLLTMEEIRQCEAKCLWGSRPESFAYRPELYMGVDIGRTHDKTVIWTVEVIQEGGRQVAVTREVVTLDNCPFPVQREQIEKRLTKDVVRCCIDQGSIGYELAEDFARYHPSQVERVALGPARQGQLAIRVREAFRSQSVLIPQNADIRRAFLKIQAVETSQGGLPVIKTPRDSTGHCDEFWALALALGGMMTRPMPKPRALPVGQVSRLASAVR